MLGLPKWAFAKLDADQITYLLTQIYLLSLDRITDRWFIDILKLKTKLYGPADGWANVSFGEFIYTEPMMRCLFLLQLQFRTFLRAS